MKIILSLLALCPFLAFAQLSIPVINDTVVVDFTGYTSAGFSPSPAAGQLNSNDWSIRGFDFDTLLDFGETQTTNDFARGPSTGDETTGGLYAFDVGGGNVTLGVQPTGNDFTPGSFTLRMQNNTGVPITDFEIAYSIWCYNDQNRSNSLNFSWSTDNITYSLVPPLDFSTPQPLDSPAAWVRTDLATVITGLSIPNGAFFYLRWTGNDAGGSGSRDEYGIDDINIIASGPTVFANFMANDVCFNDPVTFSDVSSSSGDPIVFWLWEFGDGDSTMAPNTSHNYSAPGTYSVTLLIITASGDSGSITKPVTVYPVPVAAFTASNFCQGSAVQFTDNSSIISGSIASWSWNFGDSTTSTLQNPTHIYSDTGNFVVTLTATSNQGCMDSVSYSIIIYPGPTINSSSVFITNTACGDSAGSITGITATGSGTLTYEWQNDSGITMGTLIDLTNVPAGNYTLTVQLGQCFNTAGPFQVIDTIGIPAPDAGINAFDCDLDAILTGTISGGGAIQWTLVSGPGSATFSDLTNPVCTVIVTVYGQYTFRITESNGFCIGSDDVVIIFAQSPLVGFTYAMNGLTITLTNSSTGGSPPYTYTWDFGDGAGTSNLFSPTYSYASAGLYYVCLTVEDAASCSDMFCDSVDVTVGIKENNTLPLLINIENDFVVIRNPGNIPIQQVEIFNVAGEKVASALPERKVQFLEIPLRSSRGIYFIRVMSEGDIYTNAAMK